MRRVQGLLTCHGDYDPEDEFCKTECSKRMDCMMRSDVFAVPDSVFLFLQKRREYQARAERWLKRTEHMVRSFAVGFSPSMRFKRAIKFGQLGGVWCFGRGWRNKNDER